MVYRLARLAGGTHVGRVEVYGQKLEPLRYQHARQMPADAAEAADNDVLAAREKLTRLMGLPGGPAAGFRFPERLPPLPSSEGPAADLEALAVGRRLE